MRFIKTVLLDGIGVWIFIFSAIIGPSCAGQTDKWSIIENSEGLLVLEDQDSVLFYQRAPKSKLGQFSRSNYIHPLYGLGGGVLTEDFPDDHLHQRGVYWAWHQIFIGNKRIGDGWELKDFNQNVTEVNVDKEQDYCVLSAQVDWKSPNWTDENGNQLAFVNEQVGIAVHPSNDSFRVLDFKIVVTALVDGLTIGGSEDEKGYGGFSWRMILPEDVQFTGNLGKIIPQNLALKAGPWVNVSGNIIENGRNEGIVVISHPGNPDHPQPWILRSKRSMQNAVFPGRHPIAIRRDQPLQLMYRMIIYKGIIPDNQINALSEIFAQIPY